MPEISGPRLPWELDLLIFELCDLPTLALLGRVSLDFLEATSMLLYSSLELHSASALKKLFCERAEETKKGFFYSSNPQLISRINPFLSLSQTKTLSLNFTSNQSFSSTSHTLSFARMLGSDPLPLDLLRLTWTGANPSFIHTIVTTLFQHLSPTHFHHVVGGFKSPAITTHVVGPPSPLLSWPRIEHLTYEGALMAHSQSLVPGSSQYWLTGVPMQGRKGKPVELRFQVATFLDRTRPLPHLRFIDSLGWCVKMYRLGSNSILSLVLIVASEEERVVVDKAMAKDVRFRKGMVSVVIET